MKLTIEEIKEEAQQYMFRGEDTPDLVIISLGMQDTVDSSRKWIRGIFEDFKSLQELKDYVAWLAEKDVAFNHALIRVISRVIETASRTKDLHFIRMANAKKSVDKINSDLEQEWTE